MSAAVPPPTLELIKSRIHRPTRAIVTAGMPYANGPVHLGHLAGAHVPADIYARWMRMLIGGDNVLYVCGSDDHGSASELAALRAGVPVTEFVRDVHAKQSATLERYHISFDVYSGTSQPECLAITTRLVGDFLRRIHGNGMLEKRTTRQWYDPVVKRFLQDRLVRGRCPNPQCGNDSAMSDECDRCGARYDPSDLVDPRSAISDAVPELRDTVHWWLDMWRVADTLRAWIAGKAGQWRSVVYNEAINTVLPTLAFDGGSESAYAALKAELPVHKRQSAPRRQIALQFDSTDALARAQTMLSQAGVATAPLDGWAHRSITRDVAWGVPLPDDLDPEMAGKTLYVWPESLLAPIAFTQIALARRGEDPERYAEFWKNPTAEVAQFIGQDNVYFYVVMQGALWLGAQSEPHRLPGTGDYQLTDVVGCYHLKVDGEKMSKSRGNFVTADQLLDDFSADQVRYFLALSNLQEKAANFDLDAFRDRNRFLAGPINAALERPISAAHSKFDGMVPDGVLNEKVAATTVKMAQRYVKAMSRAEYSTLLYEIETYARQINSLFTQFKPHDDRHPEESRRNGLYSAFYVLKTLMIMLYPFVPDTMDRVRQSLRLPADVFRVDEIGVPIRAGHRLGAKQAFFPAVPQKPAELEIRATATDQSSA